MSKRRAVLHFYPHGHGKPALALRFPCFDKARAFRRGFQRGVSLDFEVVEADCDWITRGAAFATPWQFFVDKWDLASLVRVEMSEDAHQ